jgi:hypothetical protein
MNTLHLSSRFSPAMAKGWGQHFLNFPTGGNNMTIQRPQCQFHFPFPIGPSGAQTNFGMLSLPDGTFRVGGPFRDAPIGEVCPAVAILVDANTGYVAASCATAKGSAGSIPALKRCLLDFATAGIHVHTVCDHTGGIAMHSPLAPVVEYLEVEQVLLGKPQDPNYPYLQHLLLRASKLISHRDIRSPSDRNNAIGAFAIDLNHCVAGPNTRRLPPGQALRLVANSGDLGMDGDAISRALEEGPRRGNRIHATANRRAAATAAPHMKSKDSTSSVPNRKSTDRGSDREKSVPGRARTPRHARSEQYLMPVSRAGESLVPPASPTYRGGFDEQL